MKRSSIYILTGLLTLGVITSCKKDFLERPPQQLAENTFWKNENDVYQVVIGVYNKLPGSDGSFLVRFIAMEHPTMHTLNIRGKVLQLMLLREQSHRLLKLGL
ncbi:hypothetical protein [Pedobacter sp. NJ-S-72]